MVIQFAKCNLQESQYEIAAKVNMKNEQKVFKMYCALAKIYNEADSKDVR